MCKRLKLACQISEDNIWRIPMTSGVFAFILGLSCFGVAMKLSEYDKSPILPPILAGIPILIAGIAGMIGGRTRKSCLISVHLVFCLIAGVLSLHLTFIFLGKEAKAREIYKAKCQSQFKGSYYCHRYAATVGMTVLAVTSFTLTPLGILSYAIIRRMTSRYNVNDEENVYGSTLDRHQDSELTSNRTDERRSSRELQAESAEPRHTRKPRNQRRHNRNNDGNSILLPGHKKGASHASNGQENDNHPPTNHPASKQETSKHAPRNPVGDGHPSRNQVPTNQALRKQISSNQTPNNYAAKSNVPDRHPVRNNAPNNQSPSNYPPSNQAPTIQVPRSYPSTNQVPSDRQPRNHQRTIMSPSNQAPRNQAPQKRIPSNHPRSNQTSSNQVQSNQAPSNQNLSNQIPRNYLQANQAPSSHPPSNQAPRNYVPSSHPPSDQTTSKQTPSNEVPRNNPCTSLTPSSQTPTPVNHTPKKQLLSNQPLSSQAPSNNVPENQTHHYPYLPRNHPLKNQVPRQSPGNLVISNSPPSGNVHNRTGFNEGQIHPQRNLYPITVAMNYSLGQSQVTSGRQKDVVFSATTDDSFA